jgi:hypothetical protein
MSTALLHPEARNLISASFGILGDVKRYAIDGTLARASLNAVIH